MRIAALIVSLFLMTSLFGATSITNSANALDSEDRTLQEAESSGDVSAASGSNRFVVWEDNTPGNYDILFKRSADNGATWQAVKNLSNNPGHSYNPQIVVSGSNVYVVWLQIDSGGTMEDILVRRSADNGAT